MRLVPAYTPDPDYIDRQIDDELARSASTPTVDIPGHHTGGPDGEDSIP